MSEIMLASGMTDGQIYDLANKVRDAARKHRDDFEKDTVQQALRSPNIGMRLLAAFQGIMEEVSKLVVRIVTVDRDRTPKQSLDATGRKQYVTDSVVEAMPRGTGTTVKLVYFKPDKSAYKNGYLSCEALAAEYKMRGLVPDPQAQIDDNAAHPESADTTPNACQWVDKDGNFYCVTFGRWNAERHVLVNRNDDVWGDDVSFAGVPQESLPLDT